MLDTLAEDKTIATAYEQERKLNQLKDQFILNVTHELRTPRQHTSHLDNLLHIHYTVAI